MVLKFAEEEVRDNFHCPFENKQCRYAHTYAERNVIIIHPEKGLRCKALMRHAPQGTRCSYLELLKAFLTLDKSKFPAKPAEEKLPRNTLYG